MSAEANKALVRRFYEEIDKGNLAAMDELVAEDYMAERVDSGAPCIARRAESCSRHPSTPQPVMRTR